MFKRDIFNVAVGIVAQTVLVIIPIYLVLHQFNEFWISLLILIVTLAILKKTWWDTLPNQR